MQSQTTEHVRRDEADGVVTVTFTRDDKRNAVSRPMYAALEQAVHDLADRDDLRVLVITAEGRYFTAGMDITTMRGAKLGEGTDGVVRGSTMRRQYRADGRHDLFDFIESIEKPVVLAAQGPCLGVGVELGASCDFRLASTAATFALPEVVNLSVIPASGGISRLTRLIGPHWAKWLAMASEQIDAQQALAIGLVHAVYPPEEFPAAVAAFAKRLAAQPREATGLAKMAIDVAADVDRRTARDFDRVAQTLLFQSKDYADRVEAFRSRSAERAARKPAAD